MILLAMLVACAPTRPPVTAPPVVTVPSAAAPDDLSFAPLETRAAALSADVDDADARERLAELRELMASMRGQPLEAQRKVFGYATRVLAVEERSRPERLDLMLDDDVREVAPVQPAQATPTSPSATPVPPSPPVADETPPQSAPSPSDEADRLARARRAVAEGRPIDAVTALEGVADPAAARMRASAIDAWARAEREAAGAAFLTARELPAGDARRDALEAVRDRLAAINARFPQNAYAAEVARHLARVEKALSEP